MAGDDLLHTVERTAVNVAQGAERLADKVVPPVERDLVRRAMDLSLRRKLLLVRRLWNDQRVRDITRVPMVMGAAYMLLPIRVLPKVLAPLRSVEKVLGLALLLWLIVRITPDEVLREHLESVEAPSLLDRMLRRE